MPRQLPLDILGFAGRAATLAALDETFRATGEAVTTTISISIITGTAGVGKTSLAVHWAHRVSHNFPDGQLYLDLRGHSKDPALTPAQALALLLQSLDVPRERIPVDPELQVGLYRSQMAGRRILVLLDNAETVEQVRPLLPASPGCHVLITSRNALGGLVVREGARRFHLDVLAPQESLEVLRRQLGTDRMTAEPEAARDLATLCAHLPLALRTVAANLAARPQRPLEHVTDELKGTNRLDRLHVCDDPDAAVTATFDLSYSALAPSAQQAFKLIGLMPGPCITRPAVAALAGRPLDDPVAELDALVSASLIEEHVPERFDCHDLLRLYADRRAQRELPVTEREKALHRLYSWYVLTADAAAELINATFVRLDRTDCDLSGVPSLLRSSSDAVQWLDRELPNLLALIHHAAHNGPRRMAWHLVDALRAHFHASRQDVEWLAAAHSALAAAEAQEQPEAIAAMLNSLGIAAFCRGEYRTAAARFGEALGAFERIGHVPGRFSALNNLGEAVHRSGSLHEAADYYRQAIQDTPPAVPGRAVTLLNYAAVRRDLGQVDNEVLLDAQTAVEWAERVSGGVAACAAWYTLASVTSLRGQYKEALGQYARALQHTREAGGTFGEIEVLAGIVTTLSRMGRHDDALAESEKLRALMHAHNSRGYEEQGLVALVGALHAAGHDEEAIATAREALELHQRQGHTLAEVRLLLLLGSAVTRTEGHEAALPYWARGLERARAIGAAEAEELARLSAVC
ncbi:tetratricopeptide repeat protein [Streptomyces sp. NPDC055722]